MRKWIRTDMPLLQGGEDASSAPYAGNRATRIDNGRFGGIGVVEQIPDWILAATLTDGVTENAAVVGGNIFNTQGGASEASAGVTVSWDVTSQELYVHQLGDSGNVLQQVLAYSGYAESYPPQITSFEMFQRFYVCPYGRESAASRRGMGYYNPTANTFTIPTFDVGGGAATLRFRGIQKHRGATILGWGYFDNTTPDKSHVLRYCEYGNPDAWVPTTAPTTAGYINIGTLNVPIVACAASGPYTVIGKTSEVFVLDGDYSEQFSVRQIGTAHGPISTAGMVSTGPLCVWMSEKGPAYSVNGADVDLLASERVLRRMSTYMDLSTACAVHDSQNTRVGFLLRRQRDLDGSPVSVNWPDQILWWDYQRDALETQGTPTTCWSIFPINAVTPTLNGPVGTPANLVSTPTTSGALLQWDHSTGDTTAQVSIEYRLTGAVPWTVLGPTAVGALNWTLSGLDAGTGYDWRLRYVKNGQYGSYTATQTFTTTAVPSDPTNVAVQVTSTYPFGGKTYVVATVSWRQTEFSSGSMVEVYENTANDFASASKILDVSSSTTSTTVTKVQDFTTEYYYWVRQHLADGTPSNPIQASGSPIIYDAP